jgi:hypothetical protein
VGKRIVLFWLLLVGAVAVAILARSRVEFCEGSLAAVVAMVVIIRTWKIRPIGMVRPRSLCRRKNGELYFKMDKDFWVRVQWRSTGDPAVGINEILFRVSSSIVINNQDEIVTVIRRFDNQSDHLLRLDHDYS